MVDNFDEDGPHRRDIVTSLERGLKVLTVFGQDSVEMTPSDVAKKTDLPRAATRRILLTLCKLGYAVTDGKYFQLTPKVLDLSHNYVRSDSVRYLIEPIMRAAVDKVKDSCTINVMDGDESVSIITSNSSAFNAIQMAEGLRIPLHVATPGRVMLAYMPAADRNDYLKRVKLTRFTQHTQTQKSALRQDIERIASTGYALGREEWELGVYALSAPIFNGSNDLVGCLTFVGNVAKVQSEDDIALRLQVLNESARHISLLLPKDAGITEMMNIAF